MKPAVVQQPGRRLNWSDAGIAVSVVLAVPLAMLVEGLAYAMVANAATWRELAVLGLFALPLLTAWSAIALSLSDRPVGLRLAVAALLLLAPPLILMGVWHA